MSEKLGRRGLFGALAGLCAAVVGFSVVGTPKRSVYQYVDDELNRRGLVVRCNVEVKS